MHEPDDENVMKIHISTYDTTDIVHKKKRQLRKPERSHIKNLHDEEKERMN